MEGKPFKRLMVECFKDGIQLADIAEERYEMENVDAEKIAHKLYDSRSAYGTHFIDGDEEAEEVMVR